MWGDRPFDELVEKLRERYSAKGLEEKYQTELRCRRRRLNELLCELCEDINRLMALSFPGENSRLADHMARDAFLTALGPDLEFAVRSEAPSSLNDALRRAQQLEVSRQVVESTPDARSRRYASRQMWDGAESEGAVGETHYEPDNGYPGQTPTTASAPSQPTTKVKDKPSDVRHSSPARSSTGRHIITDLASDNSRQPKRRRNRAVADDTRAQPDRDNDERQTSISQQLQTLLSASQQPQSQACTRVPQVYLHSFTGYKYPG